MPALPLLITKNTKMALNCLPHKALLLSHLLSSPEQSDEDMFISYGVEIIVHNSIVQVYRLVLLESLIRVHLYTCKTCIPNRNRVRNDMTNDWRSAKKYYLICELTLLNRGRRQVESRANVKSDVTCWTTAVKWFLLRSRTHTHTSAENIWFYSVPRINI